jgi:hypothetical protein
MSQDYFDTFVNKIGVKASRLALVIKPNQITHEEIENWVED